MQPHLLPCGLPGPRRTARHGHGGRRELLPTATLLPCAAAWQPSRTASSAAFNGLLPCTESSLWVGCVVVARGGRAVWASTYFVDGASWRGMASTYMMVPKDCSRSGRRRAAHLPAHQRARGMDGAAQVRGPSHRRAQQLQRCSMRFICAPACWPQMSRSRQPSLCSPGA